ncbi:hypothetical protein [Haloarcula argentinensis]|uniref:DUF2029 domain-containing protein n=1 Tax=Haloarcula argentinensis TaxID=43776 RepID=A0A830FJC1_HALAR|nr:hypothetical protein [Haloarcula argentinensis]GGM52540.1 hypothetical protein GCM10009006_37100 [Haloarcula argentinensis]
MELEVDTDVQAPDALAILVAVLLMDFGRTIWAVSAPGTWLIPVLTIYIWVTAIGLIVVGLSTIDLQEHGWAIAAIVTGAIGSTVLIAMISLYGQPVTTDVGQFLHEATALTVSGQNPYQHELGLNRTAFPTPTMDGGTVSRYSYPAGAIVAMAPQYAAGFEDVRLTPTILSLGVGVVTLAAADSEFALFAPAMLLAGDLVTWPLNGLTDTIWIFALCLAAYWWEDRLVWSAIAYGFAASVEQIPWFIGPFLLVWLLRDRGKPSAVKWLAGGLATFGLVNLPFIIWGPEAWLIGALQPLFGSGSPPVHQGVGLSALTVFGMFPIAKWAQTALVALVAVVALVVYYRRSELQWAGWVAWMPILLIHYRSFATYFVAGLPLVAIAFFERRSEHAT